MIDERKLVLELGVPRSLLARLQVAGVTVV